MAVVKRENSKFWYIQFQMNGQTFIKSARTTNKRAADQMEVDWRAKLHAQQYLGQKPAITFSEALKQYCASKVGTPFHGGLVSSAKMLGTFIPAGKKLDEITSVDLERIKRTRLAAGISSQTVRHNLNALRAAMKLAKAMGYATADLQFPELQMSRSRLRYLSEHEERQLLQGLTPARVGSGLAPWCARDAETRRNTQDVYDLVVLLLDTGARHSEISEIEWSRINLVDRSINLWRPKVRNESVLYMTDRVYEVLLRRSASAKRFVFENRKGGPRGYETKSIRKAFRRLGLDDCTVHTLRHTHASRLIQNGLSVYEVREVLGHSDIKTTMRYAHLESKHVTAKARDVVNRLNAANQVPATGGTT